VFTPYVHFAGAFCTFDPESGTLFSSDLFGGFTDDQSLYATSVAYFDAMRSFHEHYMPSREVLAHALDQIRELPVRRIAPQHGQIIPEELVAPIIDRLGRLECGIYLLARDDPGLQFLLTANRTVHDIVSTLVGEPRFPVVAAHLDELAHEHLDIEHFELWATVGDTTLLFDDSDSYVGHAADPPSDVLLALSGGVPPLGERLVLPLRSPSSDVVGGVAVLQFTDPPDLDGPARGLLDQVAGLVEVGLEREVLRRISDLDRDAASELALHDPLTGLHNRLVLSEALPRLCAIDDRHGGGQLAALMIDADHFKRVNDTHGHPAGDLVLQHIAEAIVRSVRPGDVSVRFGGEEFLVLLSTVDAERASVVAERIRTAVAAPDGDIPPVTVSVGVAIHYPGEGHEAFAARADEALYRAKAGGRDRVEVAG
jgi:diguanylate cyclase (GGDEF)-like protein